MDDSDHAQREEAYRNRNENLRNVIDVLAGYDKAALDEFGAKTRIAEDHDIERHRIDYVLNHWSELVSYRRNANRDPMDPQAVKAAYEDDTMKAMAGQGEAVPDGTGEIRVDVELSLDEVFRAIKLLPGDLGLKVYTQVLGTDIPREEIQAVLDNE